MERRLSRESTGALRLQKKMAETRRKEEPAPDLTDFMNDMFFGAVDMERKTYEYNLSGGGRGGCVVVDDEDDGFDDSTRSNSARLTQEWLQEAQRIVASSPSRHSVSPGRLVGSPRFATVQPAGSPLPSLDRTEALSRTRSARRYRTVEGISDEILLKTAKHSRNKSETFAQPSSEGDGSPATAVHRWFSNILKPANNNNSNNNNNNSSSIPPPPSPDSLPPRQPFVRKSRFQTEPSPAPHPQGIQPPNSRRTFKTFAPSLEIPNRGTPPPSSDSLPLSPPRNLVESAHRRTISSSTCSWEKIAPTRLVANSNGEEATKEDYSLNGFLKEQRILFQKFSKGEIHANVTIVLSGPSNSK